MITASFVGAEASATWFSLLGSVLSAGGGGDGGEDAASPRTPSNVVGDEDGEFHCSGSTLSVMDRRHAAMFMKKEERLPLSLLELLRHIPANSTSVYRMRTSTSRSSDRSTASRAMARRVACTSGVTSPPATFS
ncbi:hypothetical protein DQ04_06121020 [Trypanosoma grayi]|uniref:hypothetical protein n=1 Tax=Trypanosoma grayi TaxID=71804 RepID=UPI0004F49BCE|nr:hypothetical protein DQ04_06121020 [Trypanosoma grayi]KEG08951.1 hypothetical protein DQ04_06121020 [Trypanosoma grayi]